MNYKFFIYVNISNNFNINFPIKYGKYKEKLLLLLKHLQIDVVINTVVDVPRIY